jgi:hypothetical protein
VVIISLNGTSQDDVTPLATVEHIAGADTWSSHMVCTQGSWFTLYFDDQPPVRVFMIYCPDISNTIILPQHMCKHQHSPFDSFTITARRDGTTCIQFIFTHSNHVATATLLRQADLFYFMRPSAATINCATRLSAIDAELWHQRLGHPGATQLPLLHKHTTDFPSGVHSAAHRFMMCMSCMDARHQRSAAGPVQDTAPLVNGQRYHIDFGFMRASLQMYMKRDGAARVVTSFDGYNAYFIIVNAKSRYTWVFPTVSKAPPVKLLSTFLHKYGADAKPCTIRMDQGGELWHSTAIRKACLALRYIIKPTGSNSPNQNGKVERVNGTLGVMVRALLYSAGLPPSFWSAALTHAVYLKNRLVHTALGMTPYEAWTGQPPSLAHLRIFGSLVTARKPGKPAAKLDVHTSQGIFLGYGSSSKLIYYLDLTTNRVKLSNHHVFDEAHYAATTRPPGAQVLFGLGLHSPPAMLDADSPSVDCSVHGDDASSTVACAYPPPTKAAPPKLPPDAPYWPLPLAEMVWLPAPVAVAANVTRQSPAVFDLDDVHSLDMSVDPFGPSFTQHMPVKGQHPTAGLGLVYDTDQDRCIVADMCQGTPAHRIVSWRSRIRNAHLLAINGKDVHTVADVATRISELRSTDPGCIVELRLSFDDAVHGLSAAGLPQLYFDQLSVIQAHILTARTHTVNATSQSKRLTRRMLLQQEDWPEWEQAEFKQLDAYHSQGMFGTPRTPTPADIIFYWVWVYAI